MSPIKSLVTISLLSVALAACDPMREEEGYRVDPDQMAKVESGVTTKDDVIDALGSPSSVSTFPQSGEAWYYISRKTERYAFLAREATDQNVLVIQFDENDIVSEITNYDKSKARDVELVERTTPTGGNKLGFFEQIFGNFGRFNNAGTQ